MRGITKMVLGAGVIAGTVALGLGPALADPPAGVTPAPTDIVSAGSDTIQNVENKFSTDYNNTSPANPFYSYDAVPAGSTITPKSGCAAITRPNGSGAGIAALKAGAMTGSNFCIDIARSSRGPAAGDGSNGALAFVPFALDAVTWSANATTNAPVSLTTNQLKAIYSCDASIIGAGSGPVTWNEVGGTGTAQVVPVIPQSASGTRAFFLSKIGVTVLGSCVVPTDNSVEENEGTNPIFSGANAPNEVFPYSVAVYLAQSVYKHGKGTQGNLTLHQVNGVAPVGSTGKVLNKAFPYTRNVYNVVRDSGTSTHVPAYLQPLLGSGSNSGYLCTNSKAKGDIKNYGFALLGGKCGKPVIAPNGS